MQIKMENDLLEENWNVTAQPAVPTAVLLALSPGVLHYPAAPGLVTQRFSFKVADAEACSFGVYQDKGNRAADRADQTSGRVDRGEATVLPLQPR